MLHMQLRHTLHGCQAEEARARLEEAQGEEAQRRQAQDASQEEEVSAMLASL